MSVTRQGAFEHQHEHNIGNERYEPELGQPLSTAARWETRVPDLQAPRFYVFAVPGIKLQERYPLDAFVRPVVDR